MPYISDDEIRSIIDKAVQTINGGKKERRKVLWDRLWLKIKSRGALMAAVLYLLATPILHKHVVLGYVMLGARNISVGEGELTFAGFMTVLATATPAIILGIVSLSAFIEIDSRKSKNLW